MPTLRERAHDALDNELNARKAAVLAAAESEPWREPYRSAIKEVERTRAELLLAISAVTHAAIVACDTGKGGDAKCVRF